MALVACAECRQPFYASCHDCSCLDALCPWCEYVAAGSDDAVLVSDEPDETPTVSVVALADLAEPRRL
jgi:hypothetical protein